MTRVALVTGGSRGLGREAARTLTADGWTVVVTARDEAALREVVESGDAAHAVAGDATDPADVRAAVDAAEALGPLELVVANAGTFGFGGRLWEGDAQQWWRDVEVSVRGTQLLLAAALPGMVARGRGRVVALGSGMGMRATPGASAYSVAKAAVARLVETAAEELAGTGVTVLTVSPGMVPTDMTHGFPEGFLALRPELRDPEPSAWTPAERFTALLQRVAAGEADRLSGRFVHVKDDLDRLGSEGDGGLLRPARWGPPDSA